MFQIGRYYRYHRELVQMVGQRDGLYGLTIVGGNKYLPNSWKPGKVYWYNLDWCSMLEPVCIREYRKWMKLDKR